MTDDISKVVPPEAVPVRDDALNFGVVQAKDWVIPTACGVRVVDERMAYGWNECRKATIDRLESATTPAEVRDDELPGMWSNADLVGGMTDVEPRAATTPAEVDVPTIDRDEAFQRDYIPLGRSGWEIQTKGKGSTYRLCEPDGHRLAIPNEPYLHETLTRMARDVHADYATLARQLAVQRDYADKAAQRVIAAEIKQKAAEAQLAEVTRRLGEVEEVLRQIDAYHGPIRTPIHTITKLRGMARAALNKEPTK